MSATLFLNVTHSAVKNRTCKDEAGAGRTETGVSCITWLIRHSGREEEALLGGCRCCQGALVVWKNGDHERRHVTLDLLNRQRAEIRERPERESRSRGTQRALGGGGQITAPANAC